MRKLAAGTCYSEGAREEGKHQHAFETAQKMLWQLEVQQVAELVVLSVHEVSVSKLQAPQGNIVSAIGQ